MKIFGIDRRIILVLICGFSVIYMKMNWWHILWVTPFFLWLDDKVTRVSKKVIDVMVK